VVTYKFSFFFNFVEKNSLIVKKFLSVAKLASTVYETDNCVVGSWEELPNIWLTVAKNAFVGWALKLKVRMLLKGAVTIRSVVRQRQWNNEENDSNNDNNNKKNDKEENNNENDIRDDENNKDSNSDNEIDHNNNNKDDKSQTTAITMAIVIITTKAISRDNDSDNNGDNWRRKWRKRWKDLNSWQLLVLLIAKQQNY